jgi:hypothetical protein
LFGSWVGVAEVFAGFGFDVALLVLGDGAGVVGSGASVVSSGMGDWLVATSSPAATVGWS